MRVCNFSAGPSALPLEVLQEAKENLVSFENKGFSIMEISHRGEVYEKIHNETISSIKSLYNIPDNFEVIFMQGGASTQFALVPMNLNKGGFCEYVDTGVWSSKAINEAKLQGLDVRVIASSKEQNYNHIPSFTFSDNADFCYITSNNTIYGTQYKNLPQTKSPLIIDASSDIFSYEIDFNKVGMLFAGAQKNAGIAGLTIAIIRKDLLDIAKNVPTMFRYETFASSNSLNNTPPVFAIYILNLVLKWIKKQGGLNKMNTLNLKKAKLIYDIISETDDFYTAYAKQEDRSLMNVSFNIKNESLIKHFLANAQERGFLGLKGHRILGGLRASIYNAVSYENVEQLAFMMKEFKEKYK